MPYSPTPVTTTNWDAVYIAIRTAVTRGVQTTAIKAFRIARNKAPVRKVFTGGRQSVRLLTAANIRGSQAAYRKAFPLAGVRGVPLQERYGAQAGADLFPERRGTKLVLFRNQANTFKNTRIARQVVKDPYGNYLRDPYHEKFLSSQGRAELRSGRAIIEPQEQTRTEIAELSEARAGRKRRFSHEALATSTAARYQLGGGLRDSIQWDEVGDDPLVKFEVTAGNKKVNYAKYVEFGTRHAPAQPFLRPALRAVRDDLYLNVRKAIQSIG